MPSHLCPPILEAAPAAFFSSKEKWSSSATVEITAEPRRSRRLLFKELVIGQNPGGPVQCLVTPGIQFRNRAVQSVFVDVRVE